MERNDDLGEIRKLAVRAAEAAGEVVRRYFRSDVAVDVKSDASPVTVADRSAEERIRTLLEKEVPDHGILGEEHGHSRPEASCQWIIDPIDGTRSFISGSFDFGTLIAFVRDGKPLLGIIYQPVLREMMIGDGEMTELNGQRVRVRRCSDLSAAVLLSTDLITVGEYRDEASFKRLAGQVRFCRTWGNCYGYALLAAGYADVMLDPIMSVWDLMALIPIVRGAGAVITDWHGKPPENGDSIVAAAPELHDRVIRILNSTAGQ